MHERVALVRPLERLAQEKSLSPKLNMIRIIKSTRAIHAKAAEDLHKQIFPRQIAFPKKDLLWVVIDDDVVGYATAREVKQELKLTMCGIAEEYRGLKLQRRLIRARYNYAKRNALQRVVTYTTTNPPSENNLIDCGFKLYRPKNKWAGAYANYWYKNI